MSTINLSPELKQEYQRLFSTCIITPGKSGDVEAIITKIKANRTRYEAVASRLGIPWFLISVIHNMESSLSFSKHLHNGDPLTARTTHVPAGRPLTGNPPFTWEDSATDSLTLQGMDKWTDWTLPGVLYKIEEYNGFGYRRFHPHVLTPYLWSFSNQYTTGKYVEDGRWSDTVASNQCGAAVLLRRMVEEGMISFTDNSIQQLIEEKGSLFTYSVKEEPHVKEFQVFLNQIPGIYIKVDGVPATRTSDAYKKLTGHFLKGDPRLV